MKDNPKLALSTNKETLGKATINLMESSISNVTMNLMESSILAQDEC